MKENINWIFMHILILYRNAVNYNMWVGIMFMQYFRIAKYTIWCIYLIKMQRNPLLDI